MSGNSKRENRETPQTSQGTFFDLWERSENASGGTADAHVRGESDGSVVPANPTNNDGAEPLAESAEERGPAKRNVDQPALHRTPSRTKRRSRGLAGVREAARKDSKLKFTALLHHVNEDCLTEAFFNLKKTWIIEWPTLASRWFAMQTTVRQAMCARDEGLLVPRSRSAETGCKPP